jgi:hypothetical protein
MQQFPKGFHIMLDVGIVIAHMSWKNIAMDWDDSKGILKVKTP